MLVMVIKGADGHRAQGKAEPLIKAGVAQHKYRTVFDRLLPQGITEQGRADPLPLKLRVYSHRPQVQAAHLLPMIRGREADIGDHFIGMDADPIMN